MIELQITTLRSSIHDYILFRLKDWVSKQADREKEKEERKKKKLDKLRQEFKCDFNDPEYYKERSEVTDKVHEALEQGI